MLRLEHNLSIRDEKALQLPIKEDSSRRKKVLNRLEKSSAKFDEFEGDFAKFPLGSGIGN